VAASIQCKFMWGFSGFLKQ